ncbi:hypothetical protein [Bartonella birtlesii]|nr:hypothetical protein [Bartonella birtlesii]
MQKFINYAVINGCTKIYGTAGVGRSSEVYGFVYRNAKISYCAKVWGEGIWQYKTQQKKQSKIDSQKENLKKKAMLSHIMRLLNVYSHNNVYN